MIGNNNSEKNIMDDLTEWRSFGIKEVSDKNLVKFYKIIVNDMRRRGIEKPLIKNKKSQG